MVRRILLAGFVTTFCVSSLLAGTPWRRARAAASSRPTSLKASQPAAEEDLTGANQKDANAPKAKKHASRKVLSPYSMDESPMDALQNDRPMDKANAAQLKGGNGLVLNAARDGSMQWVEVEGKAMAASAAFPGGFLLRDVAAEGKVTPAALELKQQGEDFSQSGEIAGMNLKLNAQYKSFDGGITVSGELEDTSGTDRAISLYYALPVAKQSLTWHQDVRTKRPASGSQDLITSKTLAAGAIGAHSFYPVCAVTNDQAGLSLSIPMDRPVYYRLAYSPSTEMLYVVFDFALSPTTKKFPSKAAFSFNIMPVDAQWGFRSALDRYYAAFPQFFTKKVQKEGIWVYADLRPIKNVEDFGVQFHEANVALKPVEEEVNGKDAFSKNFYGKEGASALAFDDEHGIYTFRYFTPMPFNVEMPQPKKERTYDLLMKAIDEAKKRNDQKGKMARAQDSCGLKDENQQFTHAFVDLGWVHGARTTQNPDPDLPETAEAPNRAHVNFDVNDKEGLYVNDEVIGNTDKGLDGEYLDSLGVFTDKLNFARDQFASADFPLTFSLNSRKPCLVEEWSLAEFTKWLQAELYKRGKIMMSNFYPKTFCFSCPYIDAMGTETGWNETDAVSNYYRAMSG